MALKCLPTLVNGTYKGIGSSPLFVPGISVYSIEYSGDTPECYVFIDSKYLTMNGVRTEQNYLFELKDSAGNVIEVRDLTMNKLLNNVTLNSSTTAVSTSTFDHDEYKNFNVGFGTPLVYHSKGDPVLNASGLPTVEHSRTLEYYVDAIQLDARAYLGADINVNDLRKLISDTINTYANVVDKYRPELLENTHLYYRPKRSIGNANFSVGNNVVKVLPLQLATEFTLTVKSFVYEDDNLRELISSKVLEYVKAHINENTLSVTSISKTILENLNEYVDAVAVSGFNTKEDLSGTLSVEEKYDAYQTQVLKPVDDDAKLSIRRLVYVTDRKLLATERGLTVNFIV